MNTPMVYVGAHLVITMTGESDLGFDIAALLVGHGLDVVDPFEGVTDSLTPICAVPEDPAKGWGVHIDVHRNMGLYRFPVLGRDVIGPRMAEAWGIVINALDAAGYPVEMVVGVVVWRA